MNSKELALAVCRILSDKKATDILKIDVADKTILADYYVIATGRSLTHVRSLAENLEEELDKLGSSPLRSITATSSCIFSTTKAACFTISNGCGTTAKIPKRWIEEKSSTCTARGFYCVNENPAIVAWFSFTQKRAPLKKRRARFFRASGAIARRPQGKKAGTREGRGRRLFSALFRFAPAGYFCSAT